MATTVPPRASSIWDATPAARGGRARQLQEIRATARRQCEERKERVLKHDWARKRLCEFFGYERADQWNGYVPPSRDPAENGGAQLSRPNTAPQRVALVKLIRDVEEFERTGMRPGQVLDAAPLALPVAAG